MQKLLLVAFVSFCAILFACNSETKSDATASSADTTSQKLDYAYKPGYSSSFEMGNSKYAQTVLQLWKDWDNGDISSSKDLFADSVSMHFRSGEQMVGPRDSILKSSQEFRNMYSAVQSRVDAFFPIKSTDKDEDWVAVWGSEVSTEKGGKVDSVHLHEVWRFNKKGQIAEMIQYSRVAK